MPAAAPPICPTTKPPSNGSTNTIPRSAAQQLGYQRCVDRTPTLLNREFVHSPHWQGRKRLLLPDRQFEGEPNTPPLANTTVYAVMSAARARTTPFGVCSRTASACQWTFLTGVNSEMSIPAPNPRSKLPNPRGARWRLPTGIRLKASMTHRRAPPRIESGRQFRAPIIRLRPNANMLPAKAFPDSHVQLHQSLLVDDRKRRPGAGSPSRAFASIKRD